jgi:hypothetical protein
MPFNKYAEFFEPKELKMLTAAFDDAWKELRAGRPDLNTEEKAALMRKKLALRILVSATAGVRTARRLKPRLCGA